MSVNGITTSSQAYTAASSTAASTSATNKKATENKTNAKDTAAVYEKSSKTNSSTYTTNTDLVDKLKAEAEQHTMQLRSLVEKLLLKQGSSYSIANDEDMYQLLREGKVNVDAQTAAQAKKDIAEDGYWGVEQTSDRILSFAKALSGSDPDKADEMINAFVKGFKAATKSWGGELPDICQRTYDATIEKLNNWKNGTKDSTATSDSDTTTNTK
ncbi:hypothetical protein [Anaerosporobacter faecicola]|uniref:hypothetical protein n=1 Tax=Anaerosporobacter faecicola TaxID=2718714 RepID=UPI00143886D3|nr:hypothetical protein [Anaerosporobacter faecicola]